MSRRSSRLVSGGYYHSDEESDSSSVTTISYRERPVKVFKKKSGPRKKGAESDVSPVSSTVTTEKQQEASPLGFSAVSRPSLRSPACVAAGPPSTSVPSPSMVPRPPSSCPNVTRVLNFSEPTHSAVDTSGYSSSEGPCKGTSSRGIPSHAGPGADSRQWMRAAVSRLTEAVTEAVSAAQRSVVQQACSANASPRTQMKTLCGLLLLILLILLGVWFLWPWLTFLFSGMSIMKGPSWTLNPQAPGPLPNTALDAAVVSATVEAKMRHILEEMHLQHERLLAEMKKQVQVDLQSFRETGLSNLHHKLEQQQAQSLSSAASLSVRLSAVEEQMVQRAEVPPALNLLTPDLERAMDMWLTRHQQELHTAADKGSCGDCGRPLADKMPDFALESQGASVVSTRCSETYRTRSACVTLFGLPLWYPSESPRTVIQGPSVLLPGKCWAFYGVQGTLVIALSHPVRISHVTLDHLPRYNSPTGRIDSAPKDFEVYGMKNETEEGTLLGAFTYREDGEPTQTFSLPSLTDDVYHLVELRVLSNWGHIQYTCVYRFRVHGQMVQT